MSSHSSPHRRTRDEVAFVAVFAIPPGIGMAGFVAALTGEPLGATAVAAGFLTAAIIAAFLALVLRSGDDGSPPSEFA